MIGYVTLGTNNLEYAAIFYDAIAKELGAARLMENENFIAWGGKGGGSGIGLARPANGEAASVGNGTSIAFSARDRAHVDRLHALALRLGGTDEGAPGLRNGNFYAAYFRDRDGNKLSAFVVEKAGDRMSR